MQIQMMRVHMRALMVAILCSLLWTANAPIHAKIATPQVAPTGFAGAWSTNFGSLVLTPSGPTGNSFTGTMTDAGNPRARGIVTGTLLTTGKLSGTWSLNGKSGAFSNLTLDTKGETFTGSATSYTTWCGARQGKPLPAGCAFSGQWTIELNSAGAGTATLTQVGATVSGRYSTNLTSGRLTGSVTYVNGLPVLSGKWSSARSGGLFKAYLTGFDARQFQGNFDNKLAFCGWRSNTTKPRTCLK